MVENARGSTPSTREIIGHLLDKEVLRKKRVEQLAQSHAYKIEILHKELANPSSFATAGVEQKLKRLLYENKVSLTRDPFISPKDTLQQQAVLSLNLTLKWTKTLQTLAAHALNSEQILNQLQLLNTTLPAAEKLPETEPAQVTQISPKSELNTFYFDNLLKMLTSSHENAFTLNLLSAHDEMHSISCVRNKEGFWLHDPFKGSFHCQEETQFKQFLINFCSTYYPNHKEASLVQAGLKVKQELSPKPTASPSTQPQTRKELLVSHTISRESKPDEKKPMPSKPEEKPTKGPGPSKKS